VSLKRRELLAAASLAALGAPRARSAARPRVVVVGGGWGGASAARALRQMSAGAVEVLLVEASPRFVSTPMSNLVVAGLREPQVLEHSYEGLARHWGVQLVHEQALAIDADRRELRLASGRRLAYDRLLLSPGIEMMWEAVDGARAEHDAGRVLHAWQGGAEALALRRQIDAMRPGGVLAIAIPEAPLRCPPAPYERACLVAERLQRINPRAKLLVLDANAEPASEAAQFLQVFRERYAGMIEYRPEHAVIGVEAQRLRFEVQDDVQADVINLLPPMRAGALAVQAGLANSNGRWVRVRWRDFSATAAEHIHVIGDAVQSENAMAKSGAMAMAQGEVVAAALVAELTGREPALPDALAGACYSYTSRGAALALKTVHRFDTGTQAWQPDAGARVVSEVPEAALADEAWRWAEASWKRLLT